MIFSSTNFLMRRFINNANGALCALRLSSAIRQDGAPSASLKNRLFVFDAAISFAVCPLKAKQTIITLYYTTDVRRR